MSVLKCRSEHGLTACWLSRAVFAPAVAGLWAGSYWATFTIGRVVAGLYAKRVGVNRPGGGRFSGRIAGRVLLIWNPSPAANLLAVAMIGFAIAPIFPAFISGTSQRVGAHFAANTIGMQMAASGIGTAVIPSLVGVLARRFSLEVIPITLEMVFAVLLGLYMLAVEVCDGEPSFYPKMDGTDFGCVRRSRAPQNRNSSNFRIGLTLRNAGYGNNRFPFKTGARNAAGGGVTTKKAALGGPQLPAASRPRTNNVWRPCPRPLVSMAAETLSTD